MPDFVEVVVALSIPVWFCGTMWTGLFNWSHEL